MGTVTDFIGQRMVVNPQLTRNKLKELLTKEYDDEGTSTETMRGRGARRWAKKLAAVAFAEEVRSNTITQYQLVEALHNDRVWHEFIKDAYFMLSAAMALAKDYQGVWEKIKRKIAQERSQM